MPLVGETPDQWLSFGLAFVGGFGDAAGFILARTFTGLRSWSVCCPRWCTRIVLAAACPCATASAMLASIYSIDEGPTTSAVVVSDIAGVFTMAMRIYVAEKMWA
jgi:predicted permease